MSIPCTEIIRVFNCTRDEAIQAINESELLHGNHLASCQVGYLMKKHIELLRQDHDINHKLNELGVKTYDGMTMEDLLNSLQMEYSEEVGE